MTLEFPTPIQEHRVCKAPFTANRQAFKHRLQSSEIIHDNDPEYQTPNLKSLTENLLRLVTGGSGLSY